MVEQNNNQSQANENRESYTPSLGKAIAEEYEEIFEPIILDEQEVYLEHHEGGAFYPMTRVFIFDEDVVEVYGRSMGVVFEIGKEDKETLREIKKVGQEIKKKKIEDPSSPILRELNIGDKINAVKYYPPLDILERRKLERELKRKIRGNYKDR